MDKLLRNSIKKDITKTNAHVDNTSSVKEQKRLN